MNIETGNQRLTTGKQATYEILKEIFDTLYGNEQYYARVGKVVSIDETEKTAEIQIINGPIMTDVLLQQVASDSGIFISPSIGSLVIINYTEKTTAYISLYSEIDSIIFQGGTNGGLIKIVDLVTKLNNIENDINTLKSVFSAWIVNPADGGAALKTAAASWYTSTITPTVRADLENENFKH